MRKLKSNVIYSIVFLTILMLACTKSEAPKMQDAADVSEEKLVEPPKIYLEIDIEQLNKAKNGYEIPITLEDNTGYTLKIARIEETMPGIISISGVLDNKETGQAIFILRDGKLAGSVNMFTDDESYKLAYDQESERHYISLVLPANKDKLPGSEPLKRKD